MISKAKQSCGAGAGPAGLGRGCRARLNLLPWKLTGVGWTSTPQSCALSMISVVTSNSYTAMKMTATCAAKRNETSLSMGEKKATCITFLNSRLMYGETMTEKKEKGAV